MKIVLIDDYIGRWYVDENYINRQLTELEDGEEIEVRINSPGGEIYTGIAIFNKLRELAQAHSVRVRITSLCASMAAYIALAPRTVKRQAEVIVCENSIFMIHNPSAYTFGDYREMQKEADMLEKLSVMFASTFAFITDKTEKQIRKLMDEETWYFGDEVIDSGFANAFEAINKSDDALPIESAESRKIKAQSVIMSAQEKSRANYQKDDLEKVVAFFSEIFFNDENKKMMNPPSANPPKEGGYSLSAEGKGIETVTLEELKIKFPEVYNAVFTAGRDDGVKQERERVTAHLDLGKVSGSIDVADKYIRDGSLTTGNAVQADYLAANMKNARLNARLNDNPTDINTDSAIAENADEKALLTAFNAGFNGKDVSGGKV